MNIIGVIANRDKDIGLKYTQILVKAILDRGGKVKVTPDIAEELGLDNQCFDENAVFTEAEVIICLGGDGTFLKVARKAQVKNKPILGINLGNLGFLTEVEKSEIDNAIERIITDSYEVENRMMLEASIYSKGNIIVRELALNDVVISRGALSRILHLKTYINNEYVDAFPGDGLIISSPTGSTAYSLSAGGPIVEPDIDLVIVTPICPHILYSRSFITAGDRTVRVEVAESYTHEAMVTIDGQMGYEIKGGDYIEIKKAEKFVKMIRMNRKNFFNILRTKIYDRGECIRKDEI
jgi:NAD+ kinase